MSETEVETPAAVAEPGGEGTNDERIGRLESAVNEILTLIKGKPAADRTDVDDEDERMALVMRKELAKLKASEDRKAERDAERGKIAQLEDTVKKITEKPPREYRKVTRFMGWAGDDE